MPLRLFHHPVLRHSTRLCLELVALLLGVITILLVVLGWRLAQGPIRLDDLTPMVVAALSPDDAPFGVGIGETLLSWNAERRGIDLVARAVRVTDADGHVVANVPEMAMRFSPTALATLSLRPSRIVLAQPFVRMRRWPDGHVSLALGDAPEPKASDDDKPVALEDLIALLEGTADGANPLASLRQLDIDSGRLMIDDQVTGRQWLASDLKIMIRRNRQGLLASGDLVFALPGGGVPVSAKIHLPAHAPKGAALVRLGPIDPTRLADLDPALGVLKALDMAVSLEAEAGFQKTGALDSARLMLKAGKGKITLPDYYQEPLVIDSLVANLRADRTIKTVWLDDLSVAIADAKLNLKGTARQADTDTHIDLSMQAEGLTPEQLVSIWPQHTVAGARTWIAEHMSEGRIPSASASLSLRAPVAQPAALSLVSLDGQFDVAGVRVAYHPALPAVENASGQAHINASSLVFDQLTGRAKDIDISKTRVEITGFDAHDQHIVIEGDGKGPLRTILQALNHKRFGYMRQIGIDPNDISGIADTHFRFGLPLLRDLDIKDVDINVTGKVTALGMDNALAGLPITGGNLAISLDNTAMIAKGRTELAGMSVDLDWQQSLQKQDKVSSKIAFKGAGDGSIIAGILGLKDPLLEGPIAIDGVYRDLRDRGADVSMTADVTAASFVWPDGMAPINPIKVSPEKLTINASQSRTGLWQASRLSVQGQGIDITGQASQTGDDAAPETEVTFDRFVVGDTDINMAIRQTAQGAVLINLRGKMLDLNPWLKTPDDVPETEIAAPENLAQEESPLDDPVGFPLAISINVDAMRMGGTVPWQKVAGQLANDGQRWHRIQMGAQIGGAAFQMRHRGDGADHRLLLHTDDLGIFLNSLGIDNSVRSGQADIVADVKESAVTGVMTIKNAFVTDAPALMRLFSILSTQGLSALNGQTGVRFDTTEAHFIWQRGRLLLRDGRANGAQIGITFEGRVDLGAGAANRLDIEGTIVPIYTLNRIIGAIPIIGTLLTGGDGEGLFAATYSIKGPRLDPQVSVNPLAALAPGIVRRILFMGDSSADGAPKTEPEPTAILPQKD